MQSDVIHRAKVLEISGDSITLSLNDDSCREGCGGCQLKVVCGDTGKQNGRITVVSRELPSDIHPGDTVEASATEATQKLAIVTQLIIPLILLLSIVIPMASSHMPKWIAVAAGVGAVAVWDLAVWMMRRRIARHVKWTIKKV